MAAKKKFGFLSSNLLKIIAMAAMVIDHASVIFIGPENTVWRHIGRIAFPIFAFMIAEGCYYTRNKLRYFLTIFLLGLGCQTVYLVAEKSLYQNILITFSLSIIIIFSLENYRIKREKTFGKILFFTIAICGIMCYNSTRCISGCGAVW